jgi:hypothetical protein
VEVDGGEFRDRRRFLRFFEILPGELALTVCA